MKAVKTQEQKIVAILPAGGHGSRIAPLPCSKEVFPIGYRTVEDGTVRAKVVSHYLLDKVRLAGATKAYFVLRAGKWDIPDYFGDGRMVDIDIAYLMMDMPYGAPYTLDQAYPFVKESMVVFGFPDILFEPEDAFVQLLNHQQESQADIVLGLFPATNPQKMDMVEVDETGHVRQIIIKPQQTDLTNTWIIAVWTPTFTEFMHNYLIDALKADAATAPELYVGDVIRAAIAAGLPTETILFPDGNYIDIGTPDDLVKAAATFS